jgi:hypothetical protein
MRWIICMFKGHKWGDWFPWWHDAPAIVFASMEYMNDTRIYRDCARCGKHQMGLYGETQINF